MKNTRLTLTLLTACAALPASGLFAQAPAAAPTATPSVSAPASTAREETAEEGEGGGKMRAKFMALTPEERQKVKAARKAALQDPSVKAAEAERSTNRRAYRQALRAAMTKADPSVGPILEKLREENYPGKKL